MSAERTAEDILWQHISSLPYFRGMLRAVEDSFYQDIPFESPSLDLGCGDGHFAALALRGGLDVGLDPWAAPLREAKSRGCYRMTLQAAGSRMPFPDGFFCSALSNSVLEHIEDLDAVIVELGRVIKPGGLFAFAVPNQRFPQELWGRRFLSALGARRAGDSYGRNFNRKVSRHYHTDALGVWKDRLERGGFIIERTWDYFPPQALHILEWGHVFGLPALFWKKAAGRWILAARRWNLAIPYRLALPYMRDPLSEQGVCSFYVTRRRQES